MKNAKRKASKRIVRSWAQGRVLLERWRRNLVPIHVELKQPRAIDAVPVDFLRGEPVERTGLARRKFQGRLVYFTSADVTIRRPSGAILVVDNYEIAALSDSHSRLEPR
ncbi:MAG TPA: hypothetical protein VKE24_08960 [Candidatus Acidoferrales bacterium]|nr:hypothetical protein [Candidatus Acidoferrales bacterium]